MTDELTIVELLKIARRLWEIRRGKSVKHIPDFRHPEKATWVSFDGYTAICAVAPENLCDWICDLYETQGEDFDKSIARAEEPPYTKTEPEWFNLRRLPV